MDEELTVPEAIGQVAHALVLLGNAGAIASGGGEVGALEGLGMQVGEAGEAIASGLRECAEALRELADRVTTGGQDG